VKRLVILLVLIGISGCRRYPPPTTSPANPEPIATRQTAPDNPPATVGADSLVISERAAAIIDSIEAAVRDSFAQLRAEETAALNRADSIRSAARADSMAAAAARLDSMPEVRVVVVSGAGASFCAGFDVAEFAEMSGEADALAAARLGAAMADALESMRPITIAMLHGSVVGGGLVVAASCDLRIAADDTTFSIPEVDLGIPLLWGSIPRLVREIGSAHTKELVITCRTFTASEAERMGFLNRTVPEDDLVPAVESLASEIAARPPVPVELTKRQVAAAVGSGEPISDAEAVRASFAAAGSVARRKAYLERILG